jgi:hypothetical protein
LFSKDACIAFCHVHTSHCWPFMWL